MNNPQPLYVYFGHHKCASTWISQILRGVCNRLNLKYVSATRPDTFGGDLSQFIKTSDAQFFAYKQANYHYVQQLTNFRGFHVIRDPRDLIVSAYFSHMYSHPVDDFPWLAELRVQLQAASKDEGLLIEMKYIKKIIDDIASWNYEEENVFQYKMEDLTVDPITHFTRIFQFLGLMVDTPVDQARLFATRAVRRTSRALGRPLSLSNHKLSHHDLIEILERNAFSKKTGGRPIGQEDTKSHYRKGVAGDWINHFKPEHIEYCVELYNPVLLRLGYETDPDWAKQYLQNTPASISE